MRSETPSFGIAKEISALGIPAAALLFEDLGDMDPDEVDRYVVEAERGHCSEAQREPDDPVLQGFRALHAELGVRGRDLAAPEALRRLVVARGRLPRLLPIVDLYNAVSLRSAFALGAHDADHIDGDVVLRLTSGEERFVPLGKHEPEVVRPAEYAYIDSVDDVLCRLEVRQGEKTKVTAETRRYLVIVQGNPATPPSSVNALADELAALVRRLGGDGPSRRWPAS